MARPGQERLGGVSRHARVALVWNTGNWLVLVEPRQFTQDEMEAYAVDDPSAMNPLP